MFIALRKRLSSLRRRWWALIIAVILLLCFLSEKTGLTDRLLLLSGVTDPREFPLSGELQVHVLDVGNADALLIFCDGEAMLIDAGDHDDSDTISRYLQDYGVHHLSYAVATHADADHIGGMRQALAHFTVGEYLTTTVPSGAETLSATHSNLVSFLEERHIKMTEAAVGMTRQLGEAEWRVIAPVFPSNDPNEQSLVCLITYRNTRFLFMGDAGKTVETALLSEDVQADFLKVGHHGAEDATCAAFLQRVSPKTAVISCGADNPYGHPASAVLARLEVVGAAIYRTDRDGTVVVYSDGETLRVETETE